VFAALTVPYVGKHQPKSKHPPCWRMVILFLRRLLACAVGFPLVVGGTQGGKISFQGVFVALTSPYGGEHQTKSKQNPLLRKVFFIFGTPFAI